MSADNWVICPKCKRTATSQMDIEVFGASEMSKDLSVDVWVDAALADIIKDIRDLMGIGDEWQQLDVDVRNEIISKWRGFIVRSARGESALPDKPAQGEGVVTMALDVLRNVDSLLMQAGYQPDSSTRHQLSIALSMLAAAREAPPAEKAEASAVEALPIWDGDNTDPHAFERAWGGDLGICVCGRLRDNPLHNIAR